MERRGKEGVDAARDGEQTTKGGEIQQATLVRFGLRLGRGVLGVYPAVTTTATRHTPPGSRFDSLILRILSS